MVWSDFWAFLGTFSGFMGLRWCGMVVCDDVFMGFRRGLQQQDRFVSSIFKGLFDYFPTWFDLIFFFFFFFCGFMVVELGVAVVVVEGGGGFVVVMVVAWPWVSVWVCSSWWWW